MKSQARQGIVKIDGATYVIEGKPIHFSDGDRDISNPDIRSDLIEFARGMHGDGDNPKGHGRDTVYEFSPDADEPGSFVFERIHMGTLPEDVQRKIRKALDEFERVTGMQGLSEAVIDGTPVTYFVVDGARCYQLAELFRALRFPEEGVENLPSNIGNRFRDSGEFHKRENAWFGTAEGLSLYADYLGEYSRKPTVGRLRKSVARTRFLLLDRWLSTLQGAEEEASPLGLVGEGGALRDPEDEGGLEPEDMDAPAASDEAWAMRDGTPAEPDRWDAAPVPEEDAAGKVLPFPSAGEDTWNPDDEGCLGEGWLWDPEDEGEPDPSAGNVAGGLPGSPPDADDFEDLLGDVPAGAAMDGPIPDGPGPEQVSARPSVVPKGAAACAMKDALLDRLPMLCRVFGIGQDMDRDEQLAWVVWLLAFRDELVDSPDRVLDKARRGHKPTDGLREAMEEDAFLWRGKDYVFVRELVKAAMTE